MKRIYDLVFSITLIVILLPVFLLLIIVIKLTSKGPVLFKQKRIGRNNKEFILYKFRTMKLNTPNVATDLLKDPDQHITKAGKLIRKSSLDELPQLINIIRGDMTFIGPRPALYNQYELIDMRTKIGVHKLLPGVTGWAQINGRDSLTDNMKVKFDEEYLNNKSFTFDIKILFHTLFKVLRAVDVLEGGNRNLKQEGYDKVIPFQ